MKKKLLTMAALLLVCVLSAGMASAEHGYARVSDIPMAVDFTYSAGVTEKGSPYIRTDYPFEETGAMQMVLIYVKEGHPRAAEVFYDPETKYTSFGTFDEEVYTSKDRKQIIPEAVRMIRDGELVPGYIFFGTLYGDSNIDWWLEYSVPEQQYVSYEERTFSVRYNIRDAKGMQKGIRYKNGVILNSYIHKSSPVPYYAYMRLRFDAYGKLTSMSHIIKDSPETEYYEYDPETGLFDGKEIGELNWGFTEADLQVPAPAALDPVE